MKLFSFKLALVLTLALESALAQEGTHLDNQYFPASYSEARDRFLTSCLEWSDRDKNNSCDSFQVPSELDKDLFVDFLSLPAKTSKNTLIIVVSGLHGSEGYAGSAIQFMILDELAKNTQDSEVGFLFVHAMNPFGYKYTRRATENNVNLNRNMSIGDEIFLIENKAYEDLHDTLSPKGPVESIMSSWFTSLGPLIGGLVFGKYNFSQLNQAIGSGQYHFRDGLEFGGLSKEPQTIEFISRLRAVVPEYKNILLVDLHTGLGDKHQLHLILGADPLNSSSALKENLLRPVEDSDLYRLTSGSDEGFYETSGDLNQLIGPMLNDRQRLLAMTWEFGTIGSGIIGKAQTLNLLTLENQGFHYGYREPNLKRHVKKHFQ